MNPATNAIKSLPLICAMTVFTGCSSDGSDTGENITRTDTLAAIQNTIFTPTCAVSGCHSGFAASSGLALDDGAAFANLVGITSIQDSDFQLVNPGNPDDSYLVQKLEGTASGGLQMPRNQAPLNAALIQNVRDWISAGAQNN